MGENLETQLDSIVRVQESKFQFKTMSMDPIRDGFLKMTFHDLFTMFCFHIHLIQFFFQ